MIPGEHEYWTVYYRSQMTEGTARQIRETGGPGMRPIAFGATVASVLFAWYRSFRGLPEERSR